MPFSNIFPRFRSLNLLKKGLESPGKSLNFTFAKVWTPRKRKTGQWRKFTFSGGGGGAKSPKFPTKLSNFRHTPPICTWKTVFSPLLGQNFHHWNCSSHMQQKWTNIIRQLHIAGVTRLAEVKTKYIQYNHCATNIIALLTLSGLSVKGGTLPSTNASCLKKNNLMVI